MTIIKKSDLHRHITELETRYEKLKGVVSGGAPNPNIFEQYSANPDQYRNEFTEVNLTDVDYALDDFKTVLKVLGSLKKLEALKRPADK